MAGLLRGRLSSVSSLRGHLSAISSYLKLYGAPDITQHHLVRLALRGAKRQLGTAPRQKRPLSPQLMAAIYRRVDRRCPRSVACWAVLACGWWGMFRKSSLLPRTQAEQPILRRSCVRAGEQGLLVQSGFSKTNQFRARVHTVLLPKLEAKHPLCPVAALIRHFRMNRIVKDSHSLFSFVSRGQRVELTGGSLEAAFKSWLSGCGVRAADYSLHSLRRGGATSAAKLGLALEEIRSIGDWRSDAVRCYVSREGEQVKAAAKMAARLQRAAQL
jgi:hypothetical protein